MASLGLISSARVLLHKHNTAESFQHFWKRLGDVLGSRREERSQTVLQPLLHLDRMLHPTRYDMGMMLLSEEQDIPPEITEKSDKFREELEESEIGSVTLLFRGKVYLSHFIQ